ncbi:MAG TPA: nitroreductase [Firmicutes bacterium]|nr:nitroreductase [Bacillota bacterium]HHY97450.1 nitroreductase [Bacillota bacterium]
MDVYSAVMARRSVRRFRPEDISDEDLAKIIEAGRMAPSAANRQPWRFVIVRDPEKRKEVANACNGQTWLADAGAILAGIGVPAESQKWYPVDVAIAMQTMVIVASSLGYGTCWIGAFNEDKVKEVLGIPAEMRVIALTPIGRPAETPQARPRKNRGEIFFLDQFGRAM